MFNFLKKLFGKSEAPPTAAVEPAKTEPVAPYKLELPVEPPTVTVAPLPEPVATIVESIPVTAPVVSEEPAKKPKDVRKKKVVAEPTVTEPCPFENPVKNGKKQTKQSDASHAKKTPRKKNVKA